MRRVPVAFAAVLLGLLVIAGVSAASPIGPSSGAVDPTQVQAAAPTSLTAGTQAQISAVLMDAATGASIAGQNLSFERNTTFGWLPLGNATTNGQGQASVAYTPVFAGNYTVHVTYAGDSVYLPSNATIHLTVLGGGSAPPPLLTPDRVVVLVIVAVVGGVWSTYALVAWLVVGIRMDRPDPEPEASASTSGTEVNDNMAEAASSETTESKGSASAGGKPKGRSAIVMVIVALVIGVAVGAGVGYEMHGSAAPAATPPPEHLYVTIAYDPATGLDEFFPANFTIPSGVPVTITITNYDNGTNAVASSLAQVSGTVDGSESVQLWGQAAQTVTSVSTSSISHTFSISQSPVTLNIPIPASTNLAKPTIVTFTVNLATPGSYQWRCLTPCDSTAMVTNGFMEGTLTVS